MNIKKTIILSVMIHMFILVCAFGLSAKGAAFLNKTTNYLVVSLYAGSINETKPFGKRLSIIKKTYASKETPIIHNEKARETVNTAGFSASMNLRNSNETSKQTDNILGHGYHGQINGIGYETNNSAYNSNLNTVYGFIRNAIEKAKTYPLIAKKKMIQGTVVAEFSINHKGFPENMMVKKSSGSEILDSAAMKTIIKAAPFPYAEKRIEIPIKFELN